MLNATANAAFQHIISSGTLEGNQRICISIRYVEVITCQFALNNGLGDCQRPSRSSDTSGDLTVRLTSPEKQVLD